MTKSMRILLGVVLVGASLAVPMAGGASLENKPNAFSTASLRDIRVGTCVDSTMTVRPQNYCSSASSGSCPASVCSQQSVQLQITINGVVVSGSVAGQITVNVCNGCPKNQKGRIVPQDEACAAEGGSAFGQAPAGGPTRLDERLCDGQVRVNQKCVDREQIETYIVPQSKIQELYNQLVLDFRNDVRGFRNWIRQQFGWTQLPPLQQIQVEAAYTDFQCQVDPKSGALTRCAGASGSQTKLVSDPVACPVKAKTTTPTTSNSSVTKPISR